MAERSAARRDMATLFRSGTAVGLTDGELLRRAGRASAEESGAFFEAIVERHGAMVLRVCRGVLGDVPDADDAFQATFLVLARRIREARGLESVGGWLHGVAARVAARARADAARRRARETATARLSVVADELPDADRDRIVQEEVGRLPARYREVVVLCFWEGLTQEQAADRIGRPIGTVRSRSARARDLLRSRLARRGLSPEGPEPTPPAVPAPLALAAARAAAEAAAGRSPLAVVGVRPVELSYQVSRRMLMTKLVSLGTASALAIAAAVGLGRFVMASPQDPPVVLEKVAEAAAKPVAPSYTDYVVEPPDLILVEVLEALEGRPISGERLVRPDGKITLGFYGEVYVAGLTIPEVKEKIVLHLKKYLNDDILGLRYEDMKTGKPVLTAPRDSNRVFVDVTTYNSKAYYLVGAFNSPGRMPVTGSDTVLDAIQYGGGLATDADAERVLLVREKPGPGRPKTEVVDVDAILLGEEGAVNHRLGYGDRLIAKAKPPGEESGADAAPPPRPAGRSGPADPRPNPYFPGGREPSLAGVQKQLERIEAQLDALIKKQGRLEARLKKIER